VVRIEPFAEQHDYPAEFDCYIGLEGLRTLGYGPDESPLSGGRTIAFVFAIALVAGLIAGTIFLPQSQQVWQQIRAAVASIVQLGR
jgi:hypothetical protein